MLKVILQKLMLCISCETYGSLAATISFLLFFIMITLNEFSSFFLPLTAAALALVFVLRFRRPQSPQKTKKFHPIGTSQPREILNYYRIHDFMAELLRKYKTYRVATFFRNAIFTTDPAVVEYILKTNFSNYGKGLYQYKILTDLLGDGIFAVDGDKWKHQRKVSSYEFSTKILRDFSSVVFKSTAVKLARKVSEASASNRSIDMKDLFMKATLDSVFKVILGIDLDVMSNTYEEGAKFTEAFDKANAITSFRYVDVFWKIKRFLNIGSEYELRKNIKLVDDFVYKLIKRKIERLNNNPHDQLHPEKKEDLLSRFLELNETDPKFLRDIVLNFVIAGKDSTSTTLSWFFYLLCKHPDIQEKIAKEIVEETQVRSNSSIEELAAKVNEETLDKMHYLHAALSETLRLYPAVPLDAKICFSDDTLPDGFSVNKGDMILYVPYAMGRMKALWGSDAEEFRPERWLNVNGNFQPKSPFIFTAFQGGPRICLGKDFAYRQMKIFCMILLGSYKFKLNDENKPVKYRTSLTLHIEGGLHLRVFPRSSHETNA
ncbi:cytochrome P450 704C1-like [Mangifera indica]|uniref:cytochrome P450 704C1-like n=1 Tax=Mangifera indica TaxID=29780 RepID=UPI001CFA6D62|nr:cytochrome P450 704C1-like [Mangifera indica]